MGKLLINIGGKLIDLNIFISKKWNKTLDKLKVNIPDKLCNCVDGNCNCKIK